VDAVVRARVERGLGLRRPGVHVVRLRGELPPRTLLGPPRLRLADGNITAPQVLEYVPKDSEERRLPAVGLSTHR
jgi:hypothetical protein